MLLEYCLNLRRNSKWFLGGALGQYIEEQIETTRIKQAFFKIKGETRNCIAILHEGQQTEILEKGPRLNLRNQRNSSHIY